MPTPARLEGAFTAIVTPFRSGELDLDALDRVVEHQVRGGVAGIVPCGTTGESPTLSAAEQRAVIARAVAAARGRTLVIAGTGTNATRESIERTRAARAAGADAAMLVMPYYNKPTQAGLLAHVRAVHDATDLPLVLYNVPPRTAGDLLADTVARIAEACPRVVAVKEATGNVLRTQQLVAMLGDRLSVLSGDDALTLGIMACGGRGVISVTSNAVPAAVQGVVAAFLRGDLADAQRRHFALLPLHEALFLETNPGPIKAAMAELGLLAPEIRLPLVWPEPRTIEAVRAALQRLDARAAA
jgi:4-hydroxy-tetrahydrodipicolinate synthase